MWRGCSTYRSMYMSPLPNAATASAEAVLNAPGMASRLRTIFIPRPPPPAAAFRMTGSPISCAHRLASSASFTPPGLPGNSGSPASRAASRARTLLPISRMTSGRGPMKAILQERHTSANSAFSDRKPYPGWMASAPVISAADSTAGTFR